MPKTESHSRLVLTGWDCLLGLIRGDGASTKVVVNGESLRLAKIVSVARYGTLASLSKDTNPRVEASSEYLAQCLARGDCVYGVNTGFGGSADTRTDDTYGLQRSLIEMLQYGIIDLPNPERLQSRPSQPSASSFAKALPNTDPSVTMMPEAWVRASMLVRINSLASGNSGVRPDLIYCIANLIQNDIIPIVPLRGSISACGDLSPLSYVAGAIQGSPGINVWFTDAETGHRRITKARDALQASSIRPIDLGPKEGLAVVNGTAVSAGVGGLALHDAHCLAVLSQILTAMGVEALCGTDESFAPFIAAVRPHPGQIEAAHNISAFLKGSKLTCSHATNGQQAVDDGSLRQDRYSIRTSSQWLGPQLEDLLLAHEQLSIEINSTTDNPLIDPVEGQIFHGGNFQAMAVTSAMEKTRRCLQIMGRMLFAQCTELINPALNNGLPPNLTADEPSNSFLMKGVDIGIAALQAELGFLSNSIVSHVQTAEMSNQSLNSLALLSARYTHTSLDVLFQLASYHLFALCQALDLRAMQDRFSTTLKPQFEALAMRYFGSQALNEMLWPRFLKECSTRTTLDSAHRLKEAIAALQPLVLEYLTPSLECFGESTLVALEEWKTQCTALATELFASNRAAYCSQPDATPLLARASARMYTFLRHSLHIPFIHHQPSSPTGSKAEDDTVGSLVTNIYTALRNGSGFVPVMEGLREALAEGNAEMVRAKL